MLSVITLVAALVAMDGISSVALRVSDLEGAKRHYGKYLGFPVESKDAGEALVIVSPQQTIRLVAGLPESEKIRLIETVVSVKDVRAWRERLVKAGSKPDAIRGGSFTVRDPDGSVWRFQTAAAAATSGSDAISTHLEHVGVLARKSNLAAMEKFYRDTLGLTEYWRYEPKPGDLRLIKYKFPESARGDIVELMVYDGELSRKSIGSMNHVNFAVRDIHAVHRALLARGAADAPAPKVNAEQLWAMNLFDPDGTRTEIQIVQKVPAASIREEKVYGRDAWILENGLMRVALLKGGGHIAEVRQMTGDPQRDLNPMRVPHYPTIDSHTYRDAEHNATYGDDPHRWLSAGYMGHLLCFPFYGPPSSPEEIAAGLGNHGEAPIVEWKELERRVTDQAAIVRYGAELPKTHFRVERTVTLPRGMLQVHVSETVQNLLDFDRPVNWMQHATFGPPFVEPGKSVMRISAKDPALRHRTMPDKTPAGSYTAIRMDPARQSQFFTMRHADRPLTIGYVYPSEGNPWVGDWQENHNIASKPWNRQVVARGIEFGSTPYAEGLKKSIERGSSLEGTPAFRWIGARSKASTEYTIFLTEKDPQDAWIEHGAVVLR